MCLASQTKIETIERAQHWKLFSYEKGKIYSAFRNGILEDGFKAFNINGEKIYPISSPCFYTCGDFESAYRMYRDGHYEWNLRHNVAFVILPVFAYDVYTQGRLPIFPETCVDYTDQYFMCRSLSIKLSAFELLLSLKKIFDLSTEEMLKGSFNLREMINESIIAYYELLRRVPCTLSKG